LGAADAGLVVANVPRHTINAKLNLRITVVDFIQCSLRVTGVFTPAIIQVDVSSREIFDGLVKVFGGDDARILSRPDQ